MKDDAVWNAFSARLFDQNKFAIKLGLDNIRRAFALSGDPEQAAPAIVVGGTNGKGSTASALAAILQAHGLHVGLFTSPHLIELRERFRIDGVPASRAEVLAVGRAVMDRFAASDSDPCLTFFELTTLMAARIFASHHVDVVVWEVGLGGRLDAVNAVEPALTVITNIGFDHQQYLGDTIEEIAAEKAGLRREGVPLVLGPQTYPQVASIFDFPETIDVELDELPAPMLDWETEQVVAVSAVENAEVARRAARAYLGGSWNPAAADDGLAAHRWPGRMHATSHRGTRYLLDAAHNPAGTERLYAMLRRFPPRACIIGAMADKPLGQMFAPLSDLGPPVYLVEIASERAATADVLAQACRGADVAGRGNATKVFERASLEMGGGPIALFGSIYLLGEWFGWAGRDADDLRTYVDQ